MMAREMVSVLSGGLGTEFGTKAPRGLSLWTPYLPGPERRKRPVSGHQEFQYFL